MTESGSTDLLERRLLGGKVAIVTGGGRGIGRSHCLELARNGALVIVNDTGVGVRGETADEDPAKAVVAEIEANGGRAVAYQGSVVSWDDCRGLLDLATDLGGLDILVNNAGVVRPGRVTAISEADFDTVIGVHLKGTFSMTKFACEYWQSRAEGGHRTAGRIINTTSGEAFYGEPGNSAYAAAKAGIVALTTVTSHEMRQFGVTVNAISPIALTRMVRTLPSMEHRTLSVDNFDPLDPSNSSPLVAFLSSDEAAWLTGQVIRVEGNRLRRMRGWSFSETTYTARSGGRLEVDELLEGLETMWEVRAPAIKTSGGVTLTLP